MHTAILAVELYAIAILLVIGFFVGATR